MVLSPRTTSTLLCKKQPEHANATVKKRKMPKSLTKCVLCYIIINWSGERGPTGIDKHKKKSINENINENHFSKPSLSVSIRNLKFKV